MTVPEDDFYAAVDRELADELREDEEREHDPPCHRDPADAAANLCGCWR